MKRAYLILAMVLTGSFLYAQRPDSGASGSAWKKVESVVSNDSYCLVYSGEPDKSWCLSIKKRGSNSPEASGAGNG